MFLESRESGIDRAHPPFVFCSLPATVFWGKEGERRSTSYVHDQPVPYIAALYSPEQYENLLKALVPFYFNSYVHAHTGEKHLPSSDCGLGGELTRLYMAGKCDYSRSSQETRENLLIWIELSSLATMNDGTCYLTPKIIICVQVLDHTLHHIFIKLKPITNFYTPSYI